MVAHQFHAKIMGFVLGVRARRQREATSLVCAELLLLQLGIKATGECHLEIDRCARLWLIKLISQKHGV